MPLLREKLHGFVGVDDVDKIEHLAMNGCVVTEFNGVGVILNAILRAQLGGSPKKVYTIIGDMHLSDMQGTIRLLSLFRDGSLRKLPNLTRSFGK
jgi:hypothetical protein